MKFICTLILFFTCINYSFLYAKTQDEGISGSLGFIYKDENYKFDDSVTDQNSFTQEYNLNYKGNIYSPNLFNYRITSLIRFEDTKQEGSINNYTKDETSEDFGFDANVIKNSKFPFRVYYKSTNRPITNTYASEVISLLSEKKSYGLLGLVKLTNTRINYEVSKDSTVEDNSAVLQERTITKYGTSLEYRTKLDNFRMGYMHTQTERESFSNIENSSSSNDDVIDVSYSTNLADNLSSSSNFSYMTIADVTVMNARFALNWTPKTNYSGDIDMSFNRSEISYFIDSNGSSEKISQQMDTLDINQNFTYKPTKNISLVQSANYFSDKGTFSNGETASLTLNASYRDMKQLTPQRKLGFTSSLIETIRQQKRTNIVHGVNESSSSTDNQLSFNSKVDVSERLPSINSNITADIGYGFRRNSTNSSNDYSANFSLSTKFKELINSFAVSYISSGDTFSEKYSDKINYSTRVGLKGRLSANLGVEILDTTTNSSSVKSELYNAGLRFRYRFFRNIIFSNSVSINKNLGYNTLSYYYKTKLFYKRGLTEVSISYNYDYLETVETVSVRNVLQAKYKRRF